MRGKYKKVKLFSAIARAVHEWKTNKNKDLPEEENIYPADVSIIFNISSDFGVA